MMKVEANYTKVEYERRFLVLPDTKWKHNIEPYSKMLEDKYLKDSKLRLRLIRDSETGQQVIKLNKKYDSNSPYFQTISRILLSPNEYELFDSIEGFWLKKTRYYHCYLDHKFSIDVFEGELDGLILCEVEANNLNELMTIQPPDYIKDEVTQDRFFTGGNLCSITHTQLQLKLHSLPYF